jgi:hypothetical protein
VTDARAYGCRRHDCTAARSYSTAAEPAEPANPEAVAGFSPEVRDRIVADLAEHDRLMAHHEAGHAVAAAIYGRATEYAVTGPTPHVLYALGGERTEEALMTATLAGRVAAGYAVHVVAPPCEEEMGHFIAKAREGTVGTCDECRVATLLRFLYPDEADAEITRRWRQHFKNTRRPPDRPRTSGQRPAGQARDRETDRGADPAGGTMIPGELGSSVAGGRVAGNSDLSIKRCADVGLR